MFLSTNPFTISTSSASPNWHHIPTSWLDQKALLLWQKCSWFGYLPIFLLPNKTEWVLIYSPETLSLHLHIAVHTVQLNWSCRLEIYPMAVQSLFWQENSLTKVTGVDGDLLYCGFKVKLNTFWSSASDSPLHSAGKLFTKVNRPSAWGLFILYQAFCLIIWPNTYSSKVY